MNAPKCSQLIGHHFLFTVPTIRVSARTDTPDTSARPTGTNAGTVLAVTEAPASMESAAITASVAPVSPVRLFTLRGNSSLRGFKWRGIKSVSVRTYER